MSRVIRAALLVICIFNSVEIPTILINRTYTRGSYHAHLTSYLLTTYSALNAESKGERSAAEVANSDAPSPVTRTASSSSANEKVGRCPPREETAGAMDSSAHTVPVRSPKKMSIRVSAMIITAKCVRL